MLHFKYPISKYLFIVLLALAFFPVSDIHAQDITSGLVAHYTFDETSGTTATDSSGNNNTGTLTNGPVWTTGKIGGAVSFDGADDRVTLSPLDLGTLNSAAFWITNVQLSTAIIIGGSGGFYLAALDGTGATNNICYSAQFYACVNHGGLPAGQWTHIAIVRNGTAVTFYKNGVLTGSTQTMNGNFSLTIGTIGSYTPPGNSGLIYPFSGSLDDVRIYNRALSPSEIQTVYNVASGGTPPPSDTTAPTVSLTAPASGSTVSGSSVIVSANASDNVGVAGVQFKLDGANLGTEDVTSPYSMAWNTTGTSNGSHTLTATARDAAGNTTTASGVTVTVNNVSTPPPTGGTTLGNLTASMQPGTWAILNTNGFGTALLDAGFGHTILQFASKATWEPFNKRFLFLGQGHYANQKFITYSDATNIWQVESKPYWDCSPDCPGHAFEHNALDPTTGDFYYRFYASRTIYKYSRTTASWSVLPDIPTSVLPSIQVSGGLEYFPEMGGLVFVDGWGIAFFNVITNQWSKLSDPLPMGPYGNFASYNPIHHVVIFGGGNGSSNLYKLDATGAITTMANAPIGMGITSTVQTADPVSGKYIVLGTTTGALYVYDVQADIWQLQPGMSTIFNDIRDGYLIAAPVSAYGVIMYMTWNFDQSKVYLYKHSASAPSPSDTTAPSTPTNLSATAQSSSQINLSWTASTNNVGVTGYRVERCQGSTCTNFTQIATPTGTSYNDTGLTANTTYRYQVRATDAAGNLSPYSTIMSATTQSAPTGTVLGNLAASMAPGTWAELSTTGLTPSFLENGGATIFQFADSASWDPVRHKFYFLGSPHYQPYKFVIYDEASNSWSLGPSPFPADTLIHAYDHNTINPATGDVYFRQYNTVQVWKYDPNADAWSALPQPSASLAPSWQVAGALEYFPEMGGLIFVDSRIGVLFFNTSTNQWSKLSDALPMGDYHNIIEYSPVDHAVLFGGGNGSVAVYKVDSSGAVKRLADAPIGLGVTSARLSVDPASGKYIIKSFTNGAWYQYDIGADVWAPFAALGITNPPPILTDLNTQGAIEAPISNYGVVMYVQYNGGSSAPKVYLYKHSPQTFTPPPPPGGSDFSTRCSQPGVVRCYGFDDITDLTTGHPRTLTNPTDSTVSRMYGPSGGTAPCTGGQCWALDSSIKVTGASALRFEIPPNTGADTSGSFRLNFADDFSQQFGAGEEFYVQYRERFSPEMLRVFQGANGWKQSIIGLGDRVNQAIAYSCTAEEMVFTQGARLTTVGDDGFVGFYHGCGFWETMQFYDGTQVRMQTLGPPYCYYPNDPRGGCFYYSPNEWMTFKVHIKIGGWGTHPGNRVRVWAARENQPSVLISDSQLSHPNGFPIHQTDATSKYGKIWLLPYNTNKSSAEVHPTAYIWYDDLIISRNDIADPGSTTPPPTTLVGDLNQDGTVNSFDWSIMASVWFTNDATADLNSDGIVNSIDFSLMNANWGRSI